MYEVDRYAVIDHIVHRDFVLQKERKKRGNNCAQTFQWVPTSTGWLAGWLRGTNRQPSAEEPDSGKHVIGAQPSIAKSRKLKSHDAKHLSNGCVLFPVVATD